MKKKLTSGLLIAVILLWSVILYRLFIHKSKAPPVLKTTTESVPIIMDTVTDYELIADYRDPFFKKNARDKSIGVKEMPIEPPATLNTIAAPIPVRFGGIIQNSATDEQIVILNIDGKDVMFADGATYQDVTFLRNFDTYVQILYHGKTEKIYK